MPQKASYPNHVWCWDIFFEQLADGTTIKFLVLKDEFAREALLLHPARRLGAAAAVTQLAGIVAARGAPQYLRSDNGPEFVARRLRTWLAANGVNTAYIDPECPWQNGFAKSIVSTLRDECFNGELLTSLAEARVVASEQLRYYNQQRPHSALNYLPPAEFAKKFSRRKTYRDRRGTRVTHSQRRHGLAMDNSLLNPSFASQISER